MMKQRILSTLLAVCMVASLLPVSVFADDGTAADPTQQTTVQTTDTAEDKTADLSGVDAAVQAVQAQIDALPTAEEIAAMDDEGKQAVADAIDAIDAAEAALPSEQPVLLDRAKYTAAWLALTAGTEMTQTYDLPPSNPPPAGSGTPEDPYRITTVSELLAFGDLLYSGSYGHTDYWATLMNDITLNEELLNDDGTLKMDPGNVRWWGGLAFDADHPYTGTFDGNGHTISGLYHDDDTLQSALGLFSYVGAGGTVKNLTVSDSYFAGNTDVGGVVGVNEGTLTNCINNSTIRGNASVGGVAGTNKGTVTNCTNNGLATDRVSRARDASAGTDIGGVVGTNVAGATLTDDTNTGTVAGGGNVGGVCGNNAGTVTGCTNSGAVSGIQAVGGVVGNNAGSVQGCAAGATISGTTDIGGVCGINSTDSQLLDNCYYDNEKYTGDAVGSGAAATHTEGKPTAAFTSGEVAWLLNSTDASAANSQTWAQGPTMPRLAKNDKSDVIYRALFLSVAGEPLDDAQYLTTGAALTVPAGDYVWTPDPAATMAAADAEYAAVLQMITQPTAPAAKTYGYTDTQDLTVVAIGMRDVTYRWKKDGTVLAGATAATYTIPVGLAAGDHVYTCEVACGGYTMDTEPVTFTVNKAPLAWDATDLTTQKPYDGTTDAAVVGSLKLSGMLPGDAAGLTYTALVGTYADSEPGTAKPVTVTVTGAALANPNYTLPTGPIAITGHIAREMIYLPPVPGSPNKLALAAENKITKVPAALQGIETLNTPEKMEQALKGAAAERLPGVPAENIAVRDFELWCSEDGGQSWAQGVPAQFPAEGATILLPYENFGLTWEQAQGMDFTAAQMLTQGNEAGTTKGTTVTLTSKGIQFTLTAPAPVVVAYKAKPAPGKSDTTSESPAATPAPAADSAPGSFTVNAWVNVLAGGVVSPMGNATYKQGQNPTYTITPAPGYRVVKVTVDGVDVGAVSSYTFSYLNRDHRIGAYFEKTTAAGSLIPATSDEAPLTVWIVLLVLAALGLCVTFVVRNKKKK